MATTAVKKAVAARAAVASSVEVMRQELAELAAKREELVERRAAVEAAPVDRESAEGQVADLVRALAAKADLPAGWLAQPNGYAGLLRHLTATPAAVGEGAPPAEPIWPALARIAPALVEAELRRQLAETYAKLPAAMADQERRAALVEVDKELAAVERQAAGLWWEALDSVIQLPLPAEISGEALAGLAP